jgi:hypothetical protein
MPAIYVQNIWVVSCVRVFGFFFTLLELLSLCQPESNFYPQMIRDNVIRFKLKNYKFLKTSAENVFTFHWTRFGDAGGRRTPNRTRLKSVGRRTLSRTRLKSLGRRTLSRTRLKSIACQQTWWFSGPTIPWIFNFTEILSRFPKPWSPSVSLRSLNNVETWSESISKFLLSTNHNHNLLTAHLTFV